MDTYELLKYLHILAAIAWLGGGALLNVMGTQVNNQGDLKKLEDFGEQVDWFGKRYFTPLSVLVLIFGAAMVGQSDVLSFQDTWIVIGLLGIVSTIIAGAGFLGPASGRLAKSLAAGAPQSEVSAQVSRILLVARIDLIILFLIVADMVFKPGA